MNEDLQYEIKLTGADLKKIGQQLGNLPFNQVAELLNRIQSQIVEQDEKRGG